MRNPGDRGEFDPRSDLAESAVVEDLRSLARIRSLTDFRSASFAALEEAILGDVDEMPNQFARSEAVRSAVQTALDDMPDSRYRDAAVEIFGFEHGRWEPLKVRGRRASIAFGIGYDAFRRRPPDGRPGHFDTVIVELAASLVGEASPPPADQVDRDDKPNSTPADAEVVGAMAGGGERRISVLALMLAGIALLAGIAALQFLGSGESDSATDGSGPDAPPLGVIEPVAVVARDDRKPTDTPDAEDVQAVVVLPTATPALVAEDSGQIELVVVAGPVDLTGWCRAEFEASIAILLADGPESWICFFGDGQASQLIDLERACTERYGPSFHARVEIEGDGYSVVCWADLPTGGDCRVPVGAHDPDNLSIASTIEALIAAVDSAVPVACATTPAYRWLDTVTQELEWDDHSGGVVVIADRDPVILDAPEWAAYRRNRGKPPELFGYPQGPVELLDGAYTMLLDGEHRTALVARSRSGPFSWMPAVTYLPWLEGGGISGCLGAPTSDANRALRSQEFDNGTIFESPVDLSIEIVYTVPC